MKIATFYYGTNYGKKCISSRPVLIATCLPKENKPGTGLFHSDVSNTE